MEFAGASAGPEATIPAIGVFGVGDGAIEARGRSALLFTRGESAVAGALLYSNGYRLGRGQLSGGLGTGVGFAGEDPKLRDVRYFANPDPRPKASSPALK